MEVVPSGGMCIYSLVSQDKPVTSSCRCDCTTYDRVREGMAPDSRLVAVRGSQFILRQAFRL